MIFESGFEDSLFRKLSRRLRRIDTRVAVTLFALILFVLSATMQYGYQEDSKAWVAGIGEQNMRSESDRRTRSRLNEDVYLLPGLYSGLSNQRLSFFYSAAVAIKYNWTLVLPHWRLEYNDLAFGTHRSGASAPFQYFHDVRESRSGTIVSIDSENKHHVLQLPTTIVGEDAHRQLRFVSELPHTLLHDCLSQLQCNSFSECKSPEASTLERWAKDLGVVCTNAETTYYAFRSMLHDDHTDINLDDVPSLSIINDIRRSFIPSDLFLQVTTIALKNMMNRFNSTSFVSLHLRTEDDFKQACERWKPRSFLGGNTLNCFEEESSVKTLLLDSSIPKDSILLIMNGNERSALPRTICLETNYRCITKSMLLGSDFKYPHHFMQLPNSFAMLDYTISLNAQAFIGNVYSTMSVELYYEFLNTGKPAQFYNTKLATRKSIIGHLIQSLNKWYGTSSYGR